MLSTKIIDELKAAGDEKIAHHSYKFMQAYEGGYGEGDKFLGLKVPAIRAITGKYWKELSYADMERLLTSEWHEVRLAALTAMQKRMKKEPENIYRLCMNNVGFINNWDLVDVFTPDILGRYWYENNLTDILWEFARSENLWRERIAMLASSYPIRKHSDNSWAFELAEHFLGHKHDLMHKASGWMLREAGKKDKSALIGFLDKYAGAMPRTMLRYSIEKLTPQEREGYMSKPRTKTR